MLDGPLMQVFVGPLFGFDDFTVNRFLTLYFLEFLLAAALMNILLISRQTRGEE